MRSFITIKVLFGFFIFILAVPCSVASLHFHLQMMRGLISGVQKDGAKIGSGTLYNTSGHTGFYVWSDDKIHNLNAGTYIVYGEVNKGNKIRVRLEDNDWIPDNNGNGIILFSSSNRVSFNIVIDGEQYVNTDNYTLHLKAGVFGS